MHVVPFDERVTPAGHADRIFTQLSESLEQAPPRPVQVHVMPVETPSL